MLELFLYHATTASIKTKNYRHQRMTNIRLKNSENIIQTGAKRRMQEYQIIDVDQTVKSVQ